MLQRSTNTEPYARKFYYVGTVFFRLSKFGQKAAKFRLYLQAIEEDFFPTCEISSNLVTLDAGKK
jgi:hypothetical protein